MQQKTVNEPENMDQVEAVLTFRSISRGSSEEITTGILAKGMQRTN